jgi:hypothetical protein
VAKEIQGEVVEAKRVGEDGGDVGGATAAMQKASIKDEASTKAE